MSYTSRRPASFERPNFTHDGQVIIIPESPPGIALEDNILDTVRDIWQDIVGSEVEPQAFLQFEDREQNTDMSD